MTQVGSEPLRVLLATGDRELESRLVDGLPGEGIAVVARALDASALVDRVMRARGAWERDGVDVVLAAAGLHGMGEATLLALRDRHAPVLLLAADGREADRYADVAPAVLASAPVPALAEALRRTRDGSPLPSMIEPVPTTPVASWPDDDEWSHTAVDGRVVGLTSGKGAPGKTTVAIAIAAALGSVGYSVALVDADLRAGNVAPYLGLDPRRGLVGLAVAGGPLEARLASEVQDGPGCVVLAGVERPELAGALPPELVTGAIARLRSRYERVVVDLGSLPEAGALRATDHTLLVTAGDLVSLWNARLALRSLGEDGGGRWSVVVNRREGREHYDGEEIERALGVPVLGAVREDRKAARRAIERQTPLTEAGGKAAADIRAIAAALDGIFAPDPGAASADVAGAPVVVEVSRW